MSNVSEGAINAMFNQAVVSYEAGNLSSAKQILQCLTMLAPSDEGVWRALARCHDDVGESDVADRLRWLSRVISEDAS